ncbi:hypothetical protein B0H13DRAFT_2305328 [Mycena leptocephala]|nr:hypothetical protein B0H13DRAFT_2305328 [Mycena leptocephala]
MPIWWLPLFAIAVTAVLTNHTIDDSDPLVRYLPSIEKALVCHGCQDRVGSWGLYPSEVFDDTVAAFAPAGYGAGLGLELNFTGTAIYIFIVTTPSGDAAYPSVPAIGEFSMDGVPIDLLFRITPGAAAQYHIPVYANASIPDGPHTFRMDTLGTPVIFDYAIYSSNDPTSTSSTSSALSAASSSIQSPLTIKSGSKKVLVAAIGGGVAAGIVLMILSGLMLCRFRRDRVSNTQEGFRSHLGLTPPTPEYGPGGLAGQVRMLEAQVERLAARTATTPDAATARRSLSSLKREQTRALNDYGRGASTFTTQLTQSDRGLCLTAGRMEDLPPTYMANWEGRESS